MKLTKFAAEERGSANFGWLSANYSFSFANYYHPDKTHFGKLRVLNDDTIQGGKGFQPHSHANMEIISIPLKGGLKHKDSSGGGGIIRTNEVQIMSAGKGVEHSEINYLQNGETNLLQIWIIPNQHNVEPRYAQQFFDEHHRENTWQPIVSNIHPGALPIYQDAVLSRIKLTAGERVNYEVNFKDNGVYLFVIEGEIKVDNEILSPRDAIGIEQIDNFAVLAKQKSELLTIEVPMN